MIITIWVAIQNRKVVAMWNKDNVQSLRDWRKAISSAYPEANIFNRNIVIN